MEDEASSANGGATGPRRAGKSSKPSASQIDRKKSFKRSWRSTSPIRKLEIAIAGVIALGGLGYLAASVWGNLETHWNFREDERPRIAVTSFNIVDTVTKSYGLAVGHPYAVNANFSNVGKSTAYHLYVHRHVLSGGNYANLLRIEPADTKTGNDMLEPNSQPRMMSAVSVKDTYAVESLYVNPEWMIPWDGVTPIVTFGRITYEDSHGNRYCTPFGTVYLEGQTFSNLSDFSPQNIRVTDLCPPGMVE